MKSKTIKFTDIPVYRTYEITDKDDLVKKIASEPKPVNIRLLTHESIDEKIIDKIKSIQGVVSVKVVEEKTNSSTVRSPEITKKKTSKEKFKEYIASGNSELDEKTVNLAFDYLEEIENNLEINKYVPTGFYKLQKISLRGATGLLVGSGKEQIDINFDEYDEGIVALIGNNGAGKSTLIENCQPFPYILTRDGSLQNHFSLKDSFRKLWYKKDDGTIIYIDIEIDGKTKNKKGIKNGKVSYYVYTGKSEDNLKPVADCNGNLAGYEEWVRQTFGSLELFLRTSFCTKEQTSGVPDISRATKGEKKDFFISLLGTEKLEEISEIAKEKAKIEKSNMDIISAKITGRNFAEEKEETEWILEACENNLGVYTKNKVRIQMHIDSINLKLTAISKENINNIKLLLDKAESDMETYNSLKDIKSEYELFKKESNDFLAINEKIGPLKELVDKYVIKTNEFKDKQHEISTKISEKNNTIKVNKVQIKYLEKQKTISDICPECGQKIPESKIKELKEREAENKKKLSELKEANKQLAKESDKLEKDWIQANLDEAEADCKTGEYRSEIFDIQNSKLYKKYASKDLDEMKKNFEEKISSFSKMDINTIQSSLEKYQKQLSEINPDKDQKLKNWKTNLERALKKAEDSISDVNVWMGVNKQKLADLEEEEKKENALIKERNEAKEKTDALLFLSKAFGKNGIQALELEALSPEVADITNKILSSAYGDRFSIEFSTLRIDSTGKQVEDFTIKVFDSESGMQKNLQDLSSGESVWIKEALYNAFSIVRSRNSSFCFQTRFLDEADGSLDGEKRLLYLKMIEAAQKISGISHTIIITHSPELKSVIQQKISL